MTAPPQHVHEQAIRIIRALWGTDRTQMRRRIERLLETLPAHDGQPGLVDNYTQAYTHTQHPLPANPTHGKSSGHSDPTATTVLQHTTSRQHLTHATADLEDALDHVLNALDATHTALPHDPEPYTPAGTTWHRNTRTTPEAEAAIKRREMRKPHPLDLP